MMTEKSKKHLYKTLIALAMALCMLVFSACGTQKTSSAAVTLDKSAVTIAVGETVQLTASTDKAAVWISGDESVATVSDSGLVTGTGVGQANVTVTAGGGLATCVVTVVTAEGGETAELPDAIEGRGTLVWNDEVDGDTLDESKWGYQIGTHDVYGTAEGPGSWGNGEKQYYTQDAVSVSDGTLKITAEKTAEAIEKKNYTSARILTRDKASWTYGYFEARIKTPAITGMWPAFWMLPQPSGENSLENEYGGWAASGEIDIMEAKGREQNIRKVNLQEFNYFCTFTYDDKKHTEESFRKKLRNTLSHFCSRKDWRYVGVWEHSPERQRLHFHGLFYIPEGTMPGNISEVNSYSFADRSRQITLQNSYFLKEFGRNDFEDITDNRRVGDAIAYITKYMEKSGEKIVYLRGLHAYFISDITDEDVVCNIGTDDRKLLLYDDFVCIDEGVLIGKVSKEVIRQMRKCN